MLLIVVLLGAFSGAPTGASEHVPCPPGRIEVDQNLVGLLSSLCRYSQTFQRQSGRIASRADLAVVVRLGMPPGFSGGRAWTTFTPLPGGRVRADVWIRVDRDMAELVGHEFEHIVEWLDGVYATRRPRRDGVLGAERVFETERAREVGRIVARELAWR